MAYIKNLNVNLFNGKFTQIISFTANLNILSGVNGTGKTKVLQLVKQGQGVELDPTIDFGQIKILALSPKRNAEKRAQEQLMSVIRSSNISQKTQELINKQIRDDNYDPYPSFAELLYLTFDELRSRNFKTKVQQQVLDNFMRQINDEVIKLILPGYKLYASWDESSNSLTARVYKESIKDYMMNLEDLSTGEQELLSLSFNIYLTKDQFDIYLIDEPEIHLNWTLEKNLFDFLTKFSEANHKQVIITTHSRIIFDPEFQKFVIYLMWEDGIIQVKQQAPKEYKEKIAGESIQLMSVLTPTKKTIFVEDAEHEITIKALLKVFGKDENSVEILSLGSSGNIENLYGSLQPQSAFSNAWFLRDGDNQSRAPRNRFIKLKKYSIESYYLSSKILEGLCGKKQDIIINKLIEAIKNNSREITGNSKNAPFIKALIEELADGKFKPEWLDGMDCSGVIDDFIKSLNLGSKKEFMEQYVIKAFEMKLVEEIFDKELIAFIKAA